MRGNDFGSGGGATMRSPTGITNAVPRPNSPQRPRGDPRDHRGRRASPGKGSVSFDAKDPRVGGRRRGHGEMGRFGPSHSMDSDPRGGFDDDDIFGLGFACKSNEGVSAREYTKKYAPKAKQSIGVCLDHTAYAANIAGEGLTDFAMTAAEVYRQECKTDQLGDEAEFYRKHKPGEGGNKGSGKGSPGRRDRSAEPHHDGNSLITNSSSITDQDQRDSSSDQRKRKGHRRRKSEPSNLRTEGSPEAIYILSDHNDEISPPRVGRTSDRNEFESQAQGGDLMEARMELFRLGQETVPQTKVRLARALQDLKRQDKLIDGWKRQFEMTQQHLDETMAELEKTKKEAKDKQFKSTEMRARSVQDRKKFEDLYEHEIEEKKKLQDEISKLQVEVSSMKVTLRGSRQPPGAHSFTASQGPGGSPTSGQVMALKAEIVDLRSQLAEAHAASIEDTSTLHSNGEMDELKGRLRTVENEMTDLRKKDLDVQKFEKQLAETERTLTEQLELAETVAKETEAKLERDLNEALESEKRAQSELAKVKANLQRMERERSRKRINSAADIERLNKQLAKSRTETTSLQGQLEAEKEVHAEELERLGTQIEELHEKLAASNQEIADAKTEAAEQKRRWEKELIRLTGEINDLKKKLESKKDEITEQAGRIKVLEAKNLTKSYDGPISSERELSLLKEEIKFRKANENTLRADLKLHKSMLAQAQARAERKGSVSSETTMSLGGMQRELEAVRLVEEKKAKEEEANAMLRREIVSLQSKVSDLESAEFTAKSNEDSFRAEIAKLKTKLSSAEAMSYEEKFRADEERRISKESKDKHREELEELREEYEKNADEKMKLREELEELRKQLASRNSFGQESKGSGEVDGMEVPGNVKRLRNEMAIARARLAAARDQTRNVSTPSSASFPVVIPAAKSPLSDRVASPNGHSVESLSSSWAPPASKSSQHLRIVTPPVHDSVNDANSAYPIPPIRTPSSLLSGTTPQSQTSLLDEDDDEGTPFSLLHDTTARKQNSVKVASQGSRKANRPRVDDSVEELRRQLEESSKRLEKANTRLNGLVETTGLRKGQDSARSPYQGINRDTILTLKTDEEEADDGFLHDIITSDSGNIEVARLKYANI